MSSVSVEILIPLHGELSTSDEILSSYPFWFTQQEIGRVYNWINQETGQ